MSHQQKFLYDLLFDSDRCLTQVKLDLSEQILELLDSAMLLLGEVKSESLRLVRSI